MALGLEPARDTLLYVPHGLQAGQRAPLILLLHGAGGEAAGGLSLLLPLADTYRFILAAPSSRGSTWDGIRSGYGPDVDVINRALARIFELVSVPRRRLRARVSSIPPGWRIHPPALR